MKITNVARFFLLIFLALDSLAFHVARPKQFYEGDSYFEILSTEVPLEGGPFGDLVISDCLRNASRQGSATAFIPKKDGTYQRLDLPELNDCAGEQMATTNGKWIAVSSRYREADWFSIYVWDTPSNNPILQFSDPDLCKSGQFTSETTFMGMFESASTFNNHSIRQFTFENEEWSLTHYLPFAEIQDNTTVPLTSTSFGLQSLSLPPPLNTKATLLSKQASGEWGLSALLGPEYWASHEYLSQVPPTFFNGNDTLIYFGAELSSSSSGSVYVAQYRHNNNTWAIVKRFVAEDFGAENEYFNNVLSWAWHLRWINQDMALLMSPYFPLRYNATDWPYGGCVAFIYRNASGEWHAGGRIELAAREDEAIALRVMTTTQNNVVIAGLVGEFNDLRKIYLYSYPLCFPQPFQVTCLNDVEVASCEQSDVAELDTIYQWEDDGCGEPSATISSLEIADYKATVALRFERMGLNVVECTATISCPKPAPPQAATSGSAILTAVTAFYCAAIVLL